MLSSDVIGSADFREQEAPEREVDVLRRALNMLEECLPQDWGCQVDIDARPGGVAFDALVTIGSPDGSSATLAVEAKRLIATRDVADTLDQLDGLMERAGISDATPMVVARYLPPSTRERLGRAGAAYADATGNLRLTINRPAVFLRNVGADRDPWRGRGRPRGSLKGAPAARVVRALIDFAPPYSVPELVKRSGASTGATYRVVEFLEQEELLDRRPRGPITNVAWRRLLERWSQDYGFQRSEVVQSCLFPRGVEAVPEALRADAGDGYVLTGTLAAQRFAPYAPPRLAMLYVADVAAFIERMGLRPVDRGANVLLAANRDEVGFIRAQEYDGVAVAAPSQIAIDLLTGPGRSPNEGNALLDWMEANEPRWRR